MNSQELIEKYCFRCQYFSGDMSSSFCGPYADPTEDWCQVTAGELDLDELESEDDFEPGSEEHLDYLWTKVYDDILSTGYYSEVEAKKIITKKCQEALEIRKRMIESTKNINIKPMDIIPATPIRNTVEDYKFHRMVERKLMMNKNEIKEWLIKIHRIYGSLEFTKIVDEYKSFLKYKLSAEDKFMLNFALTKLIEEKVLAFKEGKTYLTKKV